MHSLFVQCCYNITYIYCEGNMTGELYLAIVIYNCAFSRCYQVLIAASRPSCYSYSPPGLRESTPLNRQYLCSATKGVVFEPFWPETKYTFLAILV